jgi:CelD/BcsL family acetyltransferase involved in cellulose biosynthesis
VSTINYPILLDERALKKVLFTALGGAAMSSSASIWRLHSRKTVSFATVPRWVNVVLSTGVAKGETSQMDPHSTRRLEVMVIEDARTFSLLEREWDELYGEAPLATPFQSWAWLYSWWEHYGEGYGLRLVTMRDGAGLLVGLMPLMVERRWGFGRLLFVGAGLTDYPDVLLREGWEERASEAGPRALGLMGGWQVADLHHLRPEAAAWGVLKRWRGPRVRLWHDNYPVIEIGPWDGLLAPLSKNLRSTVRRTIRRAQADGIQRELVKSEDASEAGRRLVALHREAWQGRDITPEHRTRRFEAYMEAAARRMTPRGLGGVSEFRRHGEVIVSHFLFFGRGFVGEGLSGATQDALRRYQESSLRIWDAVEVARSKDIPYLNLLRGEESYKLRWNPRIVPSYRIILGRNAVSWALYAGFHALRSSAKSYAYSENAPGWILRTVSKYRALRQAGIRYVKSYKR